MSNLATIQDIDIFVICAIFAIFVLLVADHTQVLAFLSNSIYSLRYNTLTKSGNLLHYKIVAQKMAKHHLSFVNCHFDDVTVTEAQH